MSSTLIDTWCNPLTTAMAAPLAPARTVPSARRRPHRPWAGVRSCPEASPGAGCRRGVLDGMLGWGGAKGEQRWWQEPKARRAPVHGAVDDEAHADRSPWRE